MGKQKYPAPKPACDEVSFLRSVAHHQMTIIRDDGVNRHIKFRQPKTGNMWFELITWPGSLCFSGDMGTYVFSRLEDMFALFRREPTETEKVRINPEYWAEKCVAADNDGIKKFTPDSFRHTVWHWMEGSSATKEDKQEIIENVISYADDGPARAMTAAMDYSTTRGYQLFDFWEADCTEYTFHFLWCCYAIAWGVQQYDAAKKEGPVAPIIDPNQVLLIAAKGALAVLSQNATFPADIEAAKKWLADAIAEVGSKEATS